MEQKKRKPINSDLIILACLAVVVLVFYICTSFRSTLDEGPPGECISISIFGKLELKNIDRAVVTVYAEEWTVTDADLVDQIVFETRTATRVDSECHADCCGCEDPHMQIDLYRGDKIIRSMEWQGCCDYVKVYEPDLTHWLFAPGYKIEAGFVKLSDKLAKRLTDLLIS